MSNDILTSLLSDYEQKKRKAEVNFEHQKVELYKKMGRVFQPAPVFLWIIFPFSTIKETKPESNAMPPNSA